MSYRSYLMIAGTLIALGSLVHSLTAADPNPPASTDDELRKSLDAESTQDYDRALLGDAATKAKGDSTTPPVKTIKPQAETLPKQLERELGNAAQAEPANKSPFVKVVEAMRNVQPRLAQRDAGETTQHIEKQIVHDLDELVEQARKSCCGGQCNKQSNSKKPSGSKSSPQQTASNQKVAAPHENPSRASSEKRNNALPSGSDGDARDFRSLVKRLWGELPETERQQLLALPDEEFLPQYEEQTKQYLRRLSEGKKASEAQP